MTHFQHSNSISHLYPRIHTILSTPNVIHSIIISLSRLHIYKFIQYNIHHYIWHHWVNSSSPTMFIVLSFFEHPIPLWVHTLRDHLHYWYYSLPISGTPVYNHHIHFLQFSLLTMYIPRFHSLLSCSYWFNQDFHFQSPSSTSIVSLSSKAHLQPCYFPLSIVLTAKSRLSWTQYVLHTF